MFARLADIDALVGDVRNGRVGTLSVSYFSSAGAAWSPPIVAAGGQRRLARAVSDGVVAVPITDPTPIRRISLRVRDVVADNPAVVRAIELLRLRVGALSPG